jgi:hypothetical protein
MPTTILSQCLGETGVVVEAKDLVLAIAVFGMSAAAASTVEDIRGDGEVHAESYAIVRFASVSPQLGRILLIKDSSGQLCAIRFSRFNRKHDAQPGDAFRSGAETFEADYDWFALADLEGREVRTVESGHATVRRSETYGVGRLVLPSVSARMKCGAAEGLSWFYPLSVSMMLGAEQRDYGIQMAPTAWKGIHEVRLSDPRLRWYRFDATGQRALHVPLSELPR